MIIDDAAIFNVLAQLSTAGKSRLMGNNQRADERHKIAENHVACADHWETQERATP